MATQESSKAVPDVLIRDYLNLLERHRDHALSLIDAMPEKHFSWRPSPDARSVSEAFLHVGVGNYLCLEALGIPPPDGLEPSRADADRFTTDKSAVRAFVDTSFERLRREIEETKKMDAVIRFFGREVTTGFALLAVLAHQARHIGQTVAYARMNGVVPPWSKPV